MGIVSIQERYIQLWGNSIDILLKDMNSWGIFML